MAPIVHGLEDEYSEQMIFSYLDIDDPENRDTMRVLGFRVQPEFYLLDGDGNVLKKWVGFVSAQDLRTEFDRALEN